MQTDCKSLVTFVSLNPNQDPIANWFWCLGFLNKTVGPQIEKAEMKLPKELETQFRKQFCLPFEGDTAKLFRELLNDVNGINLPERGILGEVWNDPRTTFGKLHGLCLARIQDRSVFRPLKIMFEPRAQYLVGIRPTPIA